MDKALQSKDTSFQYYKNSLGHSFPDLQPGDFVRYYGKDDNEIETYHAIVIYEVKSDKSIEIIDCNSL